MARIIKTQMTKVEANTVHSMSHAADLKRLARIKGQIEGIERMIRDGRYCVEILQQVKSVRAAVKGLECSILENHVKGCVRTALHAPNAAESDAKITELMDLLKSH